MDNYIKSNREGVPIQALICDRQTVNELASDFSLPDYQPEIKRLLRVRAIVSPPDKYIGAGNAEFSGTVDYSILYCGNDGALYCAGESGEYKFSVPIEMTSDFELNEGLTCDMDVTPEMTVGRVAAPRKLSVKCRLRARVRIWGVKTIQDPASGQKNDIQRLCGQAESARCFVGMGDALALGDEILLDAGSADLRVISAESQVFVTEALAGSGVVNCRGEVCLKLLCCHENTAELPTVQLRRIPFTQAVLTDGVEVNCDCCADGVTSELHITVEEGRILCEVTLRLRVRAQRNETVSFTRDLYSVSAECETHTAQYDLPRALKCINGNFSLNQTLPLEEIGIRQGMTPIDITLSPSVTSLECDHGKCYLNGRCRAHVILTDGEELSAQEFDLPFRYETDSSGAEVSDYDAVVDPISCRTRVDGERISVDAELAVSLATRTNSYVEMLTDAKFGEEISRPGAVYTVCYPSREDTLWSVAKRYHRAVNSISQINNLANSPAADSRESLMGVRYLLV